MGNVGLLVLALAIVTVIVFLLNAYHAKQAEKRFMNSLYEDCGRLAQKEYAPERFARIGSYFLRHSSPLQLEIGRAHV